MLVMFYLLRHRYAEAAAVHQELQLVEPDAVRDALVRGHPLSAAGLLVRLRLIIYIH